MAQIGIIDILQNAVERVTRAFSSITTEHKYIHEGRLFTVPIVQNIDAGATYKVTLTTPDEAEELYVHYRPAIVSTSADKVTVNLYEESATIAGGTAFTPINRLRIHPLVSKSGVLLGATVGTNGTLIDQTYIGGSVGVGAARGGGELGEENEIVLKAETAHTLEIINGSASAQIVFISIKWYEEDGY